MRIVLPELACARGRPHLPAESGWPLGLIAVRGIDRDALASRSAAAAENRGAGLGLHAGPEAVLFEPAAAVGLKCTFGHDDRLLILS